ncbi:unnamed protein product [Prunus brigantina]
MAAGKYVVLDLETSQEKQIVIVPDTSEVRVWPFILMFFLSSLAVIAITIVFW